MPPAAYIICATPRSGSTMLCDMLTASGIAGQPQSYFRAEDVQRRAREWGLVASSAVDDPDFDRRYVAAAEAAGRGGTAVFGLRLMWPSLGDLARSLNSAFDCEDDVIVQIERAFGTTMFVHLSRRDKTAQAVSLLRAEQSGLWHVFADGTERQRTAPTRVPRFDLHRLQAAERDLTTDDLAWVEFFDRHAIEPVRLFYEEVAAAPRAALTTILTALHLDPASAPYHGPETGKMADALSAEWVHRVQKLDG